MKKTLQYIVPVILSVALIWYLFKKVNFRDAMEIMSHGVDYWWIIAAMGISVFSHIFRAMRWKIQLTALNVKATLMELICSVFGCYALNLVLPRVGELWRCTFVAHRSKSHFTTVMGSMMADRMADMLMVLFLTLVTLVAAAPAMEEFLTKYPAGEGLLRVIYSPWIWISMIIVVGIVWWIFHRFHNTTPIIKVKEWISEIWNGFAAVVTMPGKWRFLMLTFAIWGCYFLQLYVAFYAFSFTRDLCSESSLGYGLLPCLVAFVLSSIGMAVPSNGGLGPWNIAVMFGLAVYGVSEVEGAAFSILQWSGQTVMLIILGVFTAIWASVTSAAKRHPKIEIKI